MAALSTRDQTSMAERLSHGLIAAVIAVALVIQLVLIFTGGADASGPSRTGTEQQPSGIVDGAGQAWGASVSGSGSYSVEGEVSAE